MDYPTNDRSLVSYIIKPSKRVLGFHEIMESHESVRPATDHWQVIISSKRRWPASISLVVGFHGGREVLKKTWRFYLLRISGDLSRQIFHLRENSSSKTHLPLPFIHNVPPTFQDYPLLPEPRKLRSTSLRVCVSRL